MRWAVLGTFVFLFGLNTNASFAADPAAGASCAGNPNGVRTCYGNGCFVCTSNVWVAQPLVIGTDASTSCTTAGLLRWNGTAIDYCNGTSWINNSILGTTATTTNPHLSGDLSTGFFSSSAATISFATNGQPRLIVDGNGNLGLGTTTPAYKLDVVGTINASGGFYQASDARFKKDIKPVQNALDNLLKIRGVSFKWIENDRPDYGVIAQNLKETFPELVSQNTEGFLSVSYNGLTSPMIEAIRELKERQDALDAQHTDLENKIDALTRMIHSMKEEISPSTHNKLLGM